MKHGNLIFTSAGDNTEFYNHWLKLKDMCLFDICIVYYGNSNKERFKEYSTYYFKKKGSKFQNFYYVYHNYQSIISKYDRFFIIDDDIIIDTRSINRLFEESKKLNVWLCQPSLLPEGKVDWSITKNNPSLKLQYTNFVEMNVPLFSKYALHIFMKKYDPYIVGWGTDLLYSHLFSIQPDFSHNKICIIHSITCVNPLEINKKNKKREIDRFMNTKKRKIVWNNWREKNNYPNGFDYIELYDCIKNT
tara:strand:+ start:12179 stop:12919 length:741 start_codon:yes stop_codon:yes gene_type:complete